MTRMLLVGVVAATAFAGSTGAAAQSADVTVTPRAEAWYRSTLGISVGNSPTCDTPVGCGPAVPPEVQSPPSQYPADTLHVGLTGGFEDARTYVTLDFSTLDPGADILGGTLSLPIDETPESGTVAPELAEIRACLVTGFVVDGVDGDLAGAPEVDCEVAADAVHVPGDGDAPSEFRVDITPFFEHWAPLAGALSLQPADDGESQAWHVAFSRRDREELVEDMRISATLDIAAEVTTEAPPTTEPTPAPTATATTSAPPPVAAAPPPVFTPPGFTAPVAPPQTFTTTPIPVTPPSPEVAVAQTEPAVVAQPAPQVQAQPALATTPVGGFAYPVVFLLPLLLATAGGWGARAFTADLSVDGGAVA